MSPAVPRPAPNAATGTVRHDGLPQRLSELADLPDSTAA